MGTGTEIGGGNGEEKRDSGQVLKAERHPNLLRLLGGELDHLCLRPSQAKGTVYHVRLVIQELQRRDALKCLGLERAHL